MDDVFSDIQTLVEERPVIARLLIGTVGATALIMVTSILWATSSAPWTSMAIGVAGIAVASYLAISSALPLDCKIGPARRTTLTCRIQSRRTAVDVVAIALTALVIGNIVTMTI